MPAMLVLIPKKPKRRAKQKRKQFIIAKNPANLPKFFPIPLKKPSQNPSQTFPDRRKIALQPRKRWNCIKNCLPPMSLTLLDAILGAQSLPREAQEPPKSCQNLAPSAKKSMFKNKSFPDSIFSWFLHGFGWFFASFLEAKTLPNC